jgi:putative acetyltransferase
VLIESRPSLDPELGALVTAQQRELRETGGIRKTPVFVPQDDSVHLVAVVAGRAVGCGAWQAMEDGAAELKRLYVRPAFRGRGIARQLIVAIEEEALAADRPVVRLQAGDFMPAAIALYRTAGYLPIPAYGEHAADPYSRCFAKRLAALVQ